MIKRTLYFGNPAYLSLRNKQLRVNKPDEETTVTVPIEDIGVMLLDHKQITVSNALLTALIDNNVALIACDHTHHPTGLFLPLEGHVLQSKRFKYQLEASEPLKKNLWAQTVRAKVVNQASLLEIFGISSKRLQPLIPQVKTGDSENVEGRAARIYWPLIAKDKCFLRDRDGLPPNAHLNYAYAVLRATVARALVSSGLLPTLGIFHKNQYNAYCLADDIMEPYRPFCDQAVMQMYYNGSIDYQGISQAHKIEMLKILTADVVIGQKKSPLMVAVNRTTHSLYECFSGKRRKLLYPKFYDTVFNK